MRKVLFATGEFFHVYNRGVDKRVIFSNERDYARFIRSMYEFNIEKSDDQARLIRIHSYCLMNNHFHLLLEQVADDGISRFMHRLGTGYTKYFNRKNDRTGCLLEATFKARHLSTTDDVVHVSRYIHLNPLDLYDASWKDSPRILNRALENMVASYPWSSFSSFAALSEEDDDAIVHRDWLLDVFKTSLAYRRFVFDWTHNRNPAFKEMAKA